ncbi:MAG: hypothetical protein ACKPKO_02005, partial [Candidatus Fonsibacter sp.]
MLYDYDENAEEEKAILQYFNIKGGQVHTTRQDNTTRSENNYCFVTIVWLPSCLGKSCSCCGDAL